MYINIWWLIKQKAREEKKSVIRLLLTYLLKALIPTIPGFFIVILFPINATSVYGWFGGIWHGFFGLCNMVIHIVHPATLYCAPLGTRAYDIFWWISFIYSSLALIGFFWMQVDNYKPKKDFGFIPAVNKNSENIKSSIEQRAIKVFISSTFKDMQKERDYLMTHTFPALQKIAAERNVDFIPIDLRWGITEEEAKSGKVLELCMREIGNALPFFIGIIGSRYGWCPSIGDFQASKLLSEEYPWMKEDIEQGMSVTEMEIQYGVLRRKERINAVFFSNAGNYDITFTEDMKGGRMARLKRAIIADGRYPIFACISPEEIGAKVHRIFIQYFDEYFPNLPTGTSTSHKPESIENNNPVYIPVKENELIIEKFLLQNNSPMLILIGEQGIGKTALLRGYLYKNNNILPEEQIASHFFGYHRLHMEDIIIQFEQKMSINTVKLLVLTRIEEYTPDEINTLSKWYKSLSNRPQIILTSNTNRVTNSAISDLKKGSIVQEIKPLNENCRKAYITEYLQRSSKKLSDAQMNRIVSHPLCKNMLILKSILDELLLFGKFELLDNKINELLSAETQIDFMLEKLRLLEKQYGKKQIQTYLSAVYLTRFGLKSEELIEIAELEEIDPGFDDLGSFLSNLKSGYNSQNYYCLEDYLQDYLIINKKGLIRLAHPLMEEAVRTRYLTNKKTVKNVQEFIKYRAR